MKIFDECLHVITEEALVIVEEGAEFKGKKDESSDEED
jgi:hypothetical protein